MFHHFQEELGRPDCLVSSTCFEYQTEAHSGATLLRSCTQNGHSPKGNEEYWTLGLPPTEFAYTTAPTLADLPVEEMDLHMSGITTSAAQWIDMDGEGAPGVLTKVPEAGWFYQRNLTYDDDPQVGEPRLVTATPNVNAANPPNWDFEDIRGDGLPDVVVTAGDGSLRGFYEREEDAGWLNFVPFESYPIIVDEPDSIHRVDLNGDGHADLLRMAPGTGGEMTWHPSHGPRGFSEGQRTVGAPSLSLQDATSSIQLCDMTGDGLADIVQIRNGSICYWPNMGHGKFGSKVIMGNAPLMARDSFFSPQYIRTADITGSGSTDLLYMCPEGGAVVYYNRSGNSWSKGHPVPSFPPLNSVSAVDVLDLGGRGTPCLCWTSDLHGNARSDGLSTVRYVDLMARKRPGLLERWSNGIGSEATFTYRSSFSFYREDQRQGTPWTTKLPFPIQCVDRTVTVDHISQLSHTTRYAYHNGYYDHDERQFRGFQMVETWDAGEFDSFASQFHRPPALTRTWFYVGLQRVDEASSLPQSFGIDAPGHHDVASATIPSNLDMAAAQEAYRALAGQERRTEVFSADPSDKKATLPYLVTQQTYEVVIPQGTSSRMVCKVQEREEITAHYERAVRDDQSPPELSCDEARVQHRLVLQTDRYGNVLLEALVQYGKSSSQLFNPEDQRRQQENVVTYTETSYTNIVKSSNYFQAPLVSETRSYRVFPGVGLAVRGRYTWESMGQQDSAILKNATEIPIDEDPDGHIKKRDPDGKGYRIMLSRERILYTMGNLREPLDCGVLEEFSVVYQSYKLAFTLALLNKSLNGARPAPDPKTLTRELKRGGYVKLPTGSGEWWTASARSIFGDDSPERRLETARSQFYIPNGEVDPYGNVSTSKFDKHHLLVNSATNAVNSTTKFDHDYCRMQPVLVTDANMNRTQTSFDPLGRPLGVAVMGKEGQPTMNSLDAFNLEIDKATMEAFFNDPVAAAASLLSTASRRTIYNLDCYHQTSKTDATTPRPVWVAELTRHDHAGVQTVIPTQISIQVSYLNGAGGVIQTALLSSRPDKRGSPTWDFSGWVINDNKGMPVQSFRPFQAPSHLFRGQADVGSVLATTTLRDPLDRVVGVLNADHSWVKTRFTPWTQVDFDPGDTVRIDDPAKDEDIGQYFERLDRSLYMPTWYGKRIAGGCPAGERQAATQSEVYTDTPTTVHLDAMGRSILEEKRSGTETRHSRTQYNIWGQVSAVHDTLDRVVDTTRHDLLGRPLHIVNMDSGRRWVLSDCQGSLLLSWSDRGTQKRVEYDALRRPTGVWIHTDDASLSKTQIIKNIYGEGLKDATSNNLHGQLFRCYDQAGLRTNYRFDVQGACVASSLRYANEYWKLLNWSVEDPQVILEEKEYTTNAIYNALSLMVETVDADLGCVRREYDVAGRLKALQSFETAMQATGMSSEGDTRYHGDNQAAVTSSVTGIQYDADGQVVHVVYGNGSQTTHTYDPEMGHLVATRTLRTGDKTILQDVSYIHDCRGKVVHTTDKASIAPLSPKTVPPTRRFWYDSFDQLVQATGRVQVDPGSKQLRPYDFNSDISDGVTSSGGQMIRYTETYTYNQAGNLKTMQNLPEGKYSGWTRQYFYEEPSSIQSGHTSNRLTRTSIGGVMQEYQYDNDVGRHGCMTSIPGYSRLGWDSEDRLHSFSTQRVSEGSTPETTWYVYDAEGTRVRKVTERGVDSAATTAPAKIKDTRYLLMGDVFSRYQGDGLTESRTTTTLNVGDPALGSAPVALVERGSHITQPLTRYRISDQLDLDGDANVVSYQEFSPFGAKTYQASNTDAPRAYRFASYRWDSESGLYFCGARYYACWLGRWTSADPLGTVDGLNLYAYVRNDPVNFGDLSGTCSEWAQGLKPRTKTKQPGKEESKSPATKPATESIKSTAKATESTTKSAEPGAGQSQGKSTTNTDTYKPKTSSTSNVATLPPPKAFTKDVPQEYITLYRASDKFRADSFVMKGDKWAVTTKATGDFNHEGDTASYWTDNFDSAMSHLKYYKSNPAIISIKVPLADLTGAKNYGKSPTREWSEVSGKSLSDFPSTFLQILADTAPSEYQRVNNDRWGAPNSDATVTAEIVRARKINVTIGPESNLSTEEYINAPAMLTHWNMNPLKDSSGRYAMQYAFKNAALSKLPTYARAYRTY